MKFNEFCKQFAVTNAEREQLRVFLLTLRVKAFLEVTHEVGCTHDSGDGPGSVSFL